MKISTIKLYEIILEETEKYLKEREGIRADPPQFVKDMMKKYGEHDTYLLLNMLRTWVFGRTETDVAQNLLKYKDILNDINPIPPLPQYLFRGLSSLDKKPNKGDKVLYTSKHRKASSWTSDYTVARGFCAGLRGDNPYDSKNQKVIDDPNHVGVWRGLVLAIDTSQLSSKQIFLWPYKGNKNILSLDDNYFESDDTFHTYEHQEEWGIYLKKETLVVSGFNPCHEKGFIKTDTTISEDDTDVIVLSDEGGKLPK